MIDFFEKFFCIKKAENVNYDVFDVLNSFFENKDSDTIAFLVGEDFLNFKDLIMDTIAKERNSLRKKTGFVLWAVHVLDNCELQENEFVIKIREKEVLRKFIIPNADEIEKEISEAINYIYNTNIEDIFTYEITEKYINSVQKDLPWTIWNITSIYTISDIREILIQLLKNKKSIKNIDYVFEKIAEHAFVYGFDTRCSPQKIAQNVCQAL